MEYYQPTGAAAPTAPLCVLLYFIYVTFSCFHIILTGGAAAR